VSPKLAEVEHATPAYEPKSICDPCAHVGFTNMMNLKCIQASELKRASLGAARYRRWHGVGIPFEVKQSDLVRSLQTTKQIHEANL
jgi:hypothetical protein